MRIYREMWENGYKLGVYGRYLRKPSQFEESCLASILRHIAFWKNGRWWLGLGFDSSWSYPKLKDMFSKLKEFEQSGTEFGEGLLAIIAVNRETKIAGFGKPTGSVVLAVMYPDSYGIIDYRTWRALNSQWARQYGVHIACRFRNECADCYEVKCRYAQGAVDFDL